MTFGRLVWWITPIEKLNPRTLWYPPLWITPVFLPLHLLVFFIQLTGVPQVVRAFNDGVSPQDRPAGNDLGRGLLALGFGL
jgi:hypothetical protein